MSDVAGLGSIRYQIADSQYSRAAFYNGLAAPKTIRTGLPGTNYYTLFIRSRGITLHSRRGIPVQAHFKSTTSGFKTRQNTLSHSDECFEFHKYLGTC